MAFLIQDIFDQEADRFERMDAEIDNHVGADPREFQKHVDPMEYTDRKFSQRYRLPKDVVNMLARQMAVLGITGPLAGQGNNLSPLLTVCVGLRFLATGSMYRDIGDAHGVSRAAVCRSIAKTLRLLMAIKDQYIAFPHTQNERRENSIAFARISNLPNVIGAIDGTHIAVKCPTEFRPYRNRKGYYSINTQLIVDADGFILDVDASWPGATHDSQVWDWSVIGRAAKTQGYLEGHFLLGDSGYPLRRWLLTPYANPETRGQHRYNYAHRRTRQVVENTIGIWKMRFRCLHGTGGILQSDPVRCSEIIVATAVLHNMAKMCGMDLLDIDNPADPMDFYDPPAPQIQPNIFGIYNDRHLYRHGQLIREDITRVRYD